MARKLELIIAVILGALAWPTVSGLLGTANAQNAGCGSRPRDPCFVAVVHSTNPGLYPFSYQYDPNNP